VCSCNINAIQWQFYSASHVNPPKILIEIIEKCEAPPEKAPATYMLMLSTADKGKAKWDYWNVFLQSRIFKEVEGFSTQFASHLSDKYPPTTEPTMKPNNCIVTGRGFSHDLSHTKANWNQKINARKWGFSFRTTDWKKSEKFCKTLKVTVISQPGSRAGPSRCGAQCKT